MAINRNYTDKNEWQKGYAIGHAGITKALEENPNKTKQGIYVAGRMLNKKMAAEHYTNNRKSDDFLAGMETAIQEVFQEQYMKAPAEQISVFGVAGMPGLVGMHIPAQIPQNPEPKKKKKETVKEEKTEEDNPDFLELF